MSNSSPLFTEDENGRTALFHAAAQGDMAQVRSIIFSLTGTGLFPQRLALISHKDNKGATAADLAASHGHHEIAKLLRSEQIRMEYFE